MQHGLVVEKIVLYFCGIFELKKWACITETNVILQFGSEDPVLLNFCLGRMSNFSELYKIRTTTAPPPQYQRLSTTLPSFGKRKTF